MMRSLGQEATDSDLHNMVGAVDTADNGLIDFHGVWQVVVVVEAADEFSAEFLTILSLGKPGTDDEDEMKEIFKARSDFFQSDIFYD